MKTDLAFLSPRSSGSFAKSLVASNWKGRGYVQIMHKPGGQPSLDQLLVRAKFSAARDFWNGLTLSEQEVYNTRAADLPLTGYNLFISEFGFGYGSAYYGMSYYGF